MVGGEKHNTKKLYRNGHVWIVVKMWTQTRYSAIIVTNRCLRDVVA